VKSKPCKGCSLTVIVFSVSIIFSGVSLTPRLSIF
jgi:hypothetical protein